MPRQSFSVLITTPCQVWSRWQLFLLLIHYFTLWPWPRNFDLWPSTFEMYRLCRVETLYQIWTQSSNKKWSYCDFNIWPNDVERCATYSARLWDKFHHVWPSTTYPCLNYSVFYADTLCHAVTLTFDMLTLKLRQRGTLYYIALRNEKFCTDFAVFQNNNDVSKRESPTSKKSKCYLTVTAPFHHCVTLAHNGTCWSHFVCELFVVSTTPVFQLAPPDPGGQDKPGAQDRGAEGNATGVGYWEGSCLSSFQAVLRPPAEKMLLVHLRHRIMLLVALLENN